MTIDPRNISAHNVVRAANRLAYRAGLPDIYDRHALQASFRLLCMNVESLGKQLDMQVPCSLLIDETELFPMIESTNRNGHARMLLEQDVNGKLTISQAQKGTPT